MSFCESNFVDLSIDLTQPFFMGRFGLRPCTKKEGLYREPTLHGPAVRRIFIFYRLERT